MNIEELSDKELDILINTRLKMRKKNITSAQIEIDEKNHEILEMLFEDKYDVKKCNLFIEWQSHKNEFDVIMGNPPFGDTAARKYLDTNLEVGETRAEIMSIEAIYKMLKSGGIAVLLLPSTISQGGRNYSKLYKFLSDNKTSLEEVYECGVVDFFSTKLNVSIFKMVKP